MITKTQEKIKPAIDAGRKLSYIEHLDELRAVLIRCIIAVVLAAILFSKYHEFFLNLLIAPVGWLVFVNPAEAFVAHVMLILFGGLVVSSPYLFWEVWRFLGQAMTGPERKYILFLAPWSIALFVVGLVFAYAVILPISLKFLLSFASKTIIPMITVQSYISYVASLCLAFACVFEMPLVIVFLTKIGIATPEFLIQKRRHAIVAIFVISAILTPPDYVSQLLMAIPMTLLYELSIYFCKITVRPKF